MKKYHLLLLSLLSGILLAAGWPARGFPGLLFIGLVPVLLVEDYIFRHPEKFIKFSLLFYSYPAFIVWNALTTWWIYNSTGVGAIIAIAVNALFMVIVFNAFHFTRKKLNNDVAAYASLVFYWIAFEYLHLNWDLNWPWLNLGNGFSSWYRWVEWYEYTGALGGTLWILVANILLAVFISQTSLLKHLKEMNTWLYSLKKKDLFFLAGIVLWIVLPIGISYTIYSNYKEKPWPVSFVVVQPNLDPYKEQYIIPPVEVVGKIMELANPLLDSTTNFLVAPESALQEPMLENDINTFRSIGLLKDILKKYPNLNILVGGSTSHEFEPGEEISNTARKYTDADIYYDAYNTAIMVNVRDGLQLYHKSKLTPGVEVLPTYKHFKLLESLAINLGGTVGSLGTDRIRKVYTTVNTIKVSPAICYESIFGEFFGEFVKNGAQVMIIITNDGWWGNSPGHRQHNSFASLRAIETRRSIARSANTGISAFIDQRGDPHQATGYWVPAAIKGTVNANDKLTFYVRHGDYIARIASGCGGIIFVLAVLFHFFRRKKTLYK
ncbi:MAG: apolipoprotein N-acyltransferase [Bacteroidetes bacterium]|nr:apolipoprotein N-acyltransferase [Bacteroidota bacterium]